MEAAVIMETATVTIPISADLHSFDRPRNTRQRDRRRRHLRAVGCSQALAIFFKESSETLLARLCLIAAAAVWAEAAASVACLVAGTLDRCHKAAAVSDCSTRTPAPARRALPAAAQPATTANTQLRATATRLILRHIPLRHPLPPTAAMGGEHKKVTTHYVCHLHNL